MSSEFKDTEMRQALLLMYLVDELSPADRLDLERKLAADAALRDELARMRAEHEAYLRAMRTLDSAWSGTFSDEAAAGRACRAVRQWAATQSTRRPAPTKPRELRVPWWSYPLVAAAAILVAIIFWGLKHHELDMLNEQPENPTANNYQSEEQPQPPAEEDDTSPAAALAELTEDQQTNLLAAFGRGASAGPSSPEEATETALASVVPEDSDAAADNALGGADDLDNPLFSSGKPAPNSAEDTR
jgi:hypothetical protein